ncbi:MAG: phosphotriesterase family protein [Armatimonadota bacterium]
MSAMTVTGPVERSALGIVLPHEHLFINLINQFKIPLDAEKKRLARQRITLSSLGVLRRNPYAIEENLILDDFDLAVSESRLFANAGGRSIVDCTSVGIGRSPERLRLLAEQTGLNILAGCGYYTFDTHLDEFTHWSAEKIADDTIRDLSIGMDGTDIRAGVIGEIGTSDPIHASEKKSLISAALAFRQTQAPIQIHTFPWGKTGLEVIDILVSHGADPARVVICHIDAEPDIEYIRKLLKTGVFVQFDNFGKEFYINPADRGFAGGNFVADLDRVRCIRQLVEMGYEGKILISNDICLKQMLHGYGGWGYDHILRNIVPMMLEEGLSDSTIRRLLEDNPASWLCPEQSCCR